MSGVKRYDIYMHSDEIQFLRECQDGDYVRWNDYDQLRDRLLALEDSLAEARPFIVKHYTADERPIIKGNGFDGLEIGEDREEAQEFVDWINARITALAALGGDK